MSAEGVEQRKAAAADIRRQLWLWTFAVLVVAHLAALYWPRVSVEGPVVWSDKVMHVLLRLPAAAGLLAGLRPAYLLVPLALHAPVSEALQHVVLPNRSGTRRTPSPTSRGSWSGPQSSWSEASARAGRLIGFRSAAHGSASGRVATETPLPTGPHRMTTVDPVRRARRA